MLTNEEDQRAHLLCNSIHFVHYVNEMWKIISRISKVSLFWMDLWLQTLENNSDVAHLLTFSVICPGPLYCKQGGKAEWYQEKKSVLLEEFNETLLYITF